MQLHLLFNHFVANSRVGLIILGSVISIFMANGTVCASIAYSNTLSTPQDTFPIPSNIPNQLFYLQRTTNTNTIVYSLHLNTKGQIIESDPVKVFWIRYAETGLQKELNILQRAFAYGVLSEKINDGTYTIKMVAYKKKELILRKMPGDTKYKIFTTIHKKNAVLNRVFIRIDPGGSLFKPNIAYIQLEGTELSTGKQTSERFKP